MSSSNRLRFTVSGILTVLLTGGCVAKFEPRISSYDLKNPGLYTAKDVRGGLEVTVEEFVSPNKSRRAFDADLAKSGVFPVLVRIENNSSDNFKIRMKEIKAYQNGEQLLPIYAYQAADKGAKRSMVWNSVANTLAMGPLAMYFGVAGIALTGQQTQGINRKVGDHFDSVELRDTLLKPDDVAAGFVFFEIPPLMDRLDNLNVEITAEKENYEGNGEKVSYHLPLPSLILHPERANGKQQ